MTAEVIASRISVLACLRASPDPSAFLALEHDRVLLLRWLDESGLALYFHHRLSASGLLPAILPELREELERRVDANFIRTQSMINELGRVQNAVGDDAQYALIKGLTLAPDFCPAPSLRHQSDFDFLVASADLNHVRDALIGIGYEVESEDSSEGVSLAIRSEHTPSKDDFLYDVPRNWHVELHPAFYEPNCGVSFAIGDNWRESIEQRTLQGITYPSLSRPFRFLGQVLHAFRHLSAWIRLSWLYEIAYFVENYRECHTLWKEILQLTENDPKARRACGVVCRLVANTFGTSFPVAIREQWVESIGADELAWIEVHSEAWLLQDFLSGNKTGLLLQRQFADSSRAWWRYRLSRLRKLLSAVLAPKGEPKFLAERFRRQMNYWKASMQWNTRAAGSRPPKR